MRIYFTAVLVLAGLVCFGQKAERVVVFHEDPHDLYANFDKDSTTLFYEKLVPKTKPVAALVILPGAGESIEEVKKQITLHSLAVQKGILVIFPSINWGTNKHIPEHQFLDTIFSQVVQQHKVPKDKFVIGGFSGGGMLALTYTQKANREKGSTFLIPKAVFGVDTPLDYAHLWKHCEKDIERNVSEAAVRESKWIIDSYTKEFGGPPDEYRDNYIKYSIFSYDEKDGGNARYLANTPVLLITEPDILWQMKNRQRDYYDLNCTDIAAMINLLQINGNKNAELVVTSNKGRRLNGQRHPHSWSIMDSRQCLNWLIKQLSSQ
jgi:hypothetical protein